MDSQDYWCDHDDHEVHHDHTASDDNADYGTTYRDGEDPDSDNYVVFGMTYTITHCVCSIIKA